MGRFRTARTRRFAAVGSIALSLSSGCAGELPPASVAPSCEPDPKDSSDPGSGWAEARGLPQEPQTSGPDAAEKRVASLKRSVPRARTAMYVGLGMFVTGAVVSAIGFAALADTPPPNSDGDDGLFILMAPIVGPVVGGAGFITMTVSMISYLSDRAELRRLTRPPGTVRVRPYLDANVRTARFGLGVALQF